MTKYLLKDKQSFDTICNIFPNFFKKFQEECNKQFNNTFNHIYISNEEEKNRNFYWAFHISKSDIEIKEDLKPYIWYDASEFDGNPNKYIIMECTVNNEGEIMYITSATYPNNTSITKKCTKFMYIKNLYQ